MVPEAGISKRLEAERITVLRRALA
jgi:hypothetical protein